METMQELAYEYLKEHGKSNFYDIWDYVLLKLRPVWKMQFPKKLMKEIEAKKMTELYTLLTCQGDFVKINDNDFGLVESFTFQEVKAMKINIGEND